MASSSPKNSLDSDEHSLENTDARPSRLPNKARHPRRKSIQFNIGGSEPQQASSRASSIAGRKRSQNDVPEKEHRNSARGHSPPPPKTYERGVSFDTFDNPDAPDFSLTLNYKHKGHQSTRRSRTFLCGTDQNDYSDFALEWLIDELVDDGDEIVCLRAVEKDSTIASDAGIEAGKYRKEAEKLFEQVIQKNSHNEKAISLVLELAVGKIQDIIQRMIRIYEPALLVVGTRGRSLGGVQGLLPGSVSKYCLQQSPIPVIVVRPSTKREKKKKKRLADPTRRSYNNILEMSERRGSQIFDGGSSTESNVSRLPGEEAAVAAALGLPQTYTNSRSSLSTSERSSGSHGDADSPSPNADSIDAARSPATPSPETTESDTGTDEEPISSKNHDGQSSQHQSSDRNGSISTQGSTASTEASTTEDEQANSTGPGENHSGPKYNIPVIVTPDDIANSKNHKS
ncbi:adenine nucleotide alpha hydrolases-like protein [Aspergillus steynii IBT 23096]|uniref:Adenine nucleotide alpha hydrolases-like protein n=1 Tax=Aspergillus steynii IBT 23096 TaxID=1392250 RepID=A0A2I2G7T1_9EURO|nr:adenine nucleotide alpha hydrolases-like protein [Aspergillus steynii IBT 23096]PLB48930.1 adenine nucleotide alpha hydrolases-like protein [Aspergillus steynii IBT 23096]